MYLLFIVLQYTQAVIPLPAPIGMLLPAS